MRPKPLIPTVIVMFPVPIVGSLAARLSGVSCLASGDVLLAQKMNSSPKGTVDCADGVLAEYLIRPGRRGLSDSGGSRLSWMLYGSPLPAA